MIAHPGRGGGARAAPRAIRAGRIPRMRILVTNDDGYDTPGIKALASAMRQVGEVVVVAPLENHSGASSSLSLHRSIRVDPVEDGVFSVDGTPSDCVHLALTANFLPWRPDLVVSGVNNGENMGDDTIYSGTVAAALEAAQFGVHGIAFSMAAKPARHYETGAKVALDIVRRHLSSPADSCRLLNVNVPDIPPGELAGIACARLGRRHFAEPVREAGRGAGGAARMYAYGEAGAAQDAGEGTDFHAVRSGRASVTPIDIDLTDHKRLAEVGAWLSGGG